MPGGYVLGPDHALDDHFLGDQAEHGPQVGQVLGDRQVDAVGGAGDREARVHDHQQIGVAECGQGPAQFGVENAASLHGGSFPFGWVGKWGGASDGPYPMGRQAAGTAPVASVMIDSSVASEVSTMPTTRPSLITAIRSVRVRSSGRSEEEQRIARPFSASVNSCS